ncbi:MAG: NUDIX domain-containing protein [Firmicutes bacterium]|nr:NUDIX domain-containing protein [Bacillota bacterium]
MIRCIMTFVYRWQNDMPEYLILKRNPTLGGYWQPVTGYIDEPETNRYAALREFHEETGIVEYERIFDPQHYYFFDMNGITCSISVLAVEVNNHADVQLSFEHTAYMWVDYHEAQTMLHWKNNIEALQILHQKLLLTKE